VQSQLGATNKVKILSYGCSIGDEAFSLRQYFPNATIKGIDINSANIAVCRKRLKAAPDSGIAFQTAASSEEESSATYDAIFCMAVLRHGSLGLPGVTRCDHVIRFEDFARAVADFERCLKPDGVLIMRHSNFRLCDAPAGQAFETILQLPTGPGTPLFGPDNRLLFRSRISGHRFSQKGYSGARCLARVRLAPSLKPLTLSCAPVTPPAGASP
jgi:SAM-dependent methyltransferase